MEHEIAVVVVVAQIQLPGFGLEQQQALVLVFGLSPFCFEH